MFQSIFLFAITKEFGVIALFSLITIFILALLISGMRKTAKLKEENERLLKSIDLNLKDTPTNTYKDFTESHAYNNK